MISSESNVDMADHSRFGGGEGRAMPSPFHHNPRPKSENILPKTDPYAYLLDGETDESVFQAIEYRGYLCKCRRPCSMWRVDNAIDGSQVPLSLVGSYTTQAHMREAIDTHLNKKEETA
jgi:hypothetical protein